MSLGPDPQPSFPVPFSLFLFAWATPAGPVQAPLLCTIQTTPAPPASPSSSPASHSSALFSFFFYAAGHGAETPLFPPLPSRAHQARLRSPPWSPSLADCLLPLCLALLLGVGLFLRLEHMPLSPCSAKFSLLFFTSERWFCHLSHL